MSLSETYDASSDADTFVVHLMRRSASDVKVTSVELLHSDMRNRYSFRNGREIEELFAARLASALRQALSRIAPGERVIALPEFEVSLPDLALAGLRILLSKGEDGVEVIMLRFRQYIGAIKSAFLFDPAMPVTSASVRERVAVEVLRDIVNPLFDIMSLARDAPESVIDDNCTVVKKQLRRLINRQEEIGFFTGLLQRYVAGCRSDVAEGRLEQAHHPAHLNGGSTEP